MNNMKPQPFRDEETKGFVLNPRVTVEKLQKPKKIYRETKNKTFLDKKDEEQRQKEIAFIKAVQKRFEEDRRRMFGSDKLQRFNT